MRTGCATTAGKTTGPTREETDMARKTASEIWMDGYRKANEEARRDWRAFVADNIFTEVDKEAVTAHEIDVREAYRVIKWLLDHTDECAHTSLERPDGNLLITTMDNVEDWLGNMGGVLGAYGYAGDGEEDE